MSKKVLVIGAGFSGLSAATSLAAKGFEVKILEKNSIAGGRARVFKAEGFTFDMGPSWYWMPDIFDNYFAQYGKKTSDYYHLTQLDPSYSVIFPGFETLPIPAGITPLKQMFEKLEAGSAEKLQQFLDEAAYKYKVGIGEFVWKPSTSIFEFFQLKLLTAAFKLDIFKSFSSHIRRFFKHPKLIQLLEFPVLFLGATPQNTPALYSLMNYAEMKMGTWYPMGGMHEIVKAMVALAIEKGVKIEYDVEIDNFFVENKEVKGVKAKQNTYYADAVVASADYHHIEELLGDENRNYSEKYWDKRTMAPSSLLFYLGVNKKIAKLEHHNLFFDEDFDGHAHDIYTDPKWPRKPLFYVSAPSKTDPSVAPSGCENIFILMPVAPNLQDNEAIREQYFDSLMKRLETYCGENIKDSIIYKKSYAHSNFVADYHAFKGNAYGLANTLFQTAFLKPSLKSKKVRNLYYTGQLTVPGPGVPPSLISGMVVANVLEKELNKK
jgi:phytoene desaturase